MSAAQVENLSAVTDMLVEVDRTISQLLAVKEGLLAVGSRLAMDVGADAVAAESEQGAALAGSQQADAVELASRAVAAEFGAAMLLSDRTVQRRMCEAEAKVERFPLVWRAQGAGLISAAHARTIMDAGSHLDEPAARDAYSEQMIGLAKTMSPGRVARMARRVAESLQRRSLEERHREARKRRRIWMRGREDGTAELTIFGPAALVHGAHDRLTAQALSIHGDAVARAEQNDTRSLDEIRCDLALEFLLTGAAAAHDPEGLLTGIRAEVSVTVPVTTLLGIDDAPAELDGRIPIDAATARALAGAATAWDRMLTHPITGALLTVDRYRPSAELKRWLRARDQRCRFPGCGYPAGDCDIDHTQDAARGGPTDAGNLGHLCRRHHVTKHQTPWTVRRHDGGVFEWTSPTGRVYSDPPPRPNSLTSAHDDEPPPF